MAIYYTTNPSEFKLTDSVIIAEQAQPSSGKLSGGPALTGIVGVFPWGPTNELLEFTDGNDLIETLVGGYDDPGAYQGYRAIANKTFGGPLRIVRAVASDAVKASRALSDTAGPTLAVDLTAKYLGVAGNQITTLWTQVSGAVFTLVVAMGNIEETFADVDFDAAGMAYVTANSALIDAALNGAAGNNPDTDVAAVTMALGSDGTIADLDYTGSATDAFGLRVLRQMEDGGFVFVAEHTSAAIITELGLHVAIKLCNAAAQADASNDQGTANTAAGLVADERLRLFNHRVTQTINGVVYTVDLTAFYASIWSSIDPSESVAQKKWRNPYLTPITGLPSGVELTRAEWIEADAVGAIMLEKNTDGGYKFHMDITSDTTDGSTSSVRRRMHDVVNLETGSALENFANAKPTPANRRAAKASMDKRLVTLQSNEQIEEFSTVEVAKDGDSVTYETKVKLFGELRFIINKTQVGENVVIDEIA
jgi:hypothetical protein